MAVLMMVLEELLGPKTINILPW